MLWRLKQDSNLWHHRSETLTHCSLGALRTALCFFLLKHRLYLPQEAAALEPVNSRKRAVNVTVAGLSFVSKANKKNHPNGWFLLLAPQTGLEPVTPRLTAACSTDWAIKAKWKSVGVDLSSRAASSQVFSALLSLTTVFGMGTGGPSTSSTPTIYRYAPLTH